MSRGGCPKVNTLFVRVVLRHAVRFNLMKNKCPKVPDALATIPHRMYAGASPSFNHGGALRISKNAAACRVCKSAVCWGRGERWYGLTSHTVNAAKLTHYY